jgi:serine/threonine protein kinase
MCQKCKQKGVTGGCNTWFDLSRIGLAGTGCVRDPEFLASIHVSSTQDILNQLLYINSGGRLLQWVGNMPGAKYSRVELGLRQAGADLRHVFVKRPLLPGKSLLYEACIQQIVKDSLDRGGFPHGAASVFDVFKLRDDSICFSMEIFHDAKPLSVLMEHMPDAELTPMLLEILLQLCAMLWHLATDIGMNHRDLKPSNIMVEVHAPRPRTLLVGTKRIEIMSKYTLSLVDFGFSCIGQSDSQVSDIALGDVYPKRDPCPKGGRDFFMFLAFLYIDCWRRVGTDFRMYFARWLQDNETHILSKLEKYGLEFDQWIYFIVGNEDIHQFGCDPCTIFNDLLVLTGSR